MINFLFKGSDREKKQNLETSSKVPLTKRQPFSLDELNPVPKGWRIGVPDFIGIAAVKAGTSWWHSLLLEHPQIVENRLKQKELRYFAHFKYQGIEQEQISTYHQAFAAPEGSICGEWSPIYLSYPLCIKNIAKAAPNTKILAILRNPIDRTVSALNETAYGSKSFGFDAEQQYVYDVFLSYPIKMRASCYAHQLRQLLYYFDRSQILLLQYEKCKINPEQEIARTYRFLGVDDKYQPQNLKKTVNRKKYLVESLKPEERQHLATYFADDVRATVEMFPEIDLSLWSDFD
jgi:hypothetical protein